LSPIRCLRWSGRCSKRIIWRKVDPRISVKRDCQHWYCTCLLHFKPSSFTLFFISPYLISFHFQFFISLFIVRKLQLSSKVYKRFPNTCQ
jgi:hypothetical protein